MNPLTNDDWVEYRRLVLSKLEGLEVVQNLNTERIEDIRRELATMKVKAGLMGALTSALTTLGVALLWWLSKA